MLASALWCALLTAPHFLACFQLFLLSPGHRRCWHTPAHTQYTDRHTHILSHALAPCPLCAMAVPSGGAARAKGVITPLSSKLPWPPHTHSVGKTVVKMLTYMRHLYTNTRTHKLLHIPSSKTNDISVVGRLATRHSFISNRLSELIWALSQINFAAVFFPDLSVSSDISLIWWACSKSIG